jgi:hypothetical protein
MEINPAASAMITANVAVGTAVLKTAIDTQAEAALALIQSVSEASEASQVNLPPNLGQNINVTA